MGLKNVLSGVHFTDPTLPKVRDEQLLTAGSLFLFDPTHSLRPITGALADSLVVPNVAYQEALAVLGTGTQASVDGALKVDAGFTTARGKLERSAKGGIHGICSQTQFTGASQGAGIELPVALRSYMRLNPTHVFYLSVWERVTRPALALAAGVNPAIAPGTAGLASGSSATNNRFVLMQTSGASLGSGGTHDVPLPGREAPGLGAVGTGYRAGAGPFVGVAPTTDANMMGYVASWGQWGRSGLDTFPSSYPAHSSRVFYRGYVEDLTVSGRTFAQVDALDFARYTADVTTAGGRYYNDTVPTDPATIP